MYVIGTAGHVDHGKSLLVEALTGIDPDRLREEKARGMTIDLGFAWLTLPSGREVSIVDVPGHERFIKNMLAGAGGIDLALLVVAADDGVMPQTREHLAILDLLDVRRGVVALTKRDLVDDDWLALIAADITETLAGTTLEGAPVVPCSAVTRAGLDDLLGALDAAVEGLPPKRDIARPRLSIDRVFTIAGFGTVVTGTLIDGALCAGDEVEAIPGGLRGRVRGLQSHRTKVERALPGTRTAVNIAGVAKDGLRRGMVLAPPGRLRATVVVDARVRAVASIPRPLRHNARLTFHSGADEANATLRLLDADELRPGDSAWAQIRLATPVAVARGDRFVLRTPDDTVAGGVIADVAPKRHRRRDPAVTAALQALLSDTPDEVVLSAIARRPLVERAALAAELTLPAGALAATLAALVASGAVRRFGEEAAPRFATADAANALSRQAADALAAYHRAHHLRPGMPLQELRTRLRLDAAAFDAVSAAWDSVRVRDGVAALASFTPRVSADEQRAIDAFLASLRAGAVAPSLPPELLAYLVQSGAVVDAGGIIFDGAAFDAMAAAVRAEIVRQGAVTLARTRDLLGTGRKQAQALLEELDRRHVTRRDGDARVLR
ncbi:MAG: selenocysteine-specific translation elongation factor [Chloroflexota bacterium]|nr:selenocysteine-specific translation elongation factor [Chloroflexota bacterium]